MADRAYMVFAVLCLMFGAFAWGVATVKWKVFPHGALVQVEAGFVALTRLEEDSLPHHVIRPPTNRDRDTMFLRISDTAPEDPILLTGGFFYRMDVCPVFGCMAMIVTRSGEVLHSWEADPEALFTDDVMAEFDGFPGPTNLLVQGVALDPEGGLIVTFQGRNIYPYQVGIARFSWDGTLDWLRTDHSHHWPNAFDDGTVAVPIARIERDRDHVAQTQQSLSCRFGAVYQEGMRVLSLDGEVVREFWLQDLIEASDMQGLVYAVRDDCDPFHLNGIDRLNAAAARRIPGAVAGDYVLSLRSSSALVVIDQFTGVIHDVMTGPMVAQHSPVVHPDGRVIVFDNLGGIDTEKGTRIIALDPENGAETLFPVSPDGPGGDLFTEAQGAVNISDDGRFALVSETLNGRVIEVDLATGAATWIHTAISDLRPFAERVGGAVPDGPLLRVMQTQGAEYVSRTDLVRFQRLAYFRQ